MIMDLKKDFNILRRESHTDEWTYITLKTFSLSLSLLLLFFILLILDLSYNEKFLLKYLIFVNKKYIDG